MREIAKEQNEAVVNQRAAETANIGIANLPVSRVSMPEHQDFHLISDDELSKLYNPAGSTLANFGFCLLGSALGLSPSLFDVLDKVNSAVPVLSSEILAVLLFAGAAVGSVICLVISATNALRNKGLASAIRKRKSTSIQ